MNNTVELSRLLTATTYAVDCFTAGELFSSGSGFCISSDGVLITAAHVVTGRTPIRIQDVQDPDLTIFARLSGGNTIPYRPVTVCITVRHPEFLESPLQIDLAILQPLVELANVPHLLVAENIFPVGTEVLMAGFPDEIEMPFQLDAALGDRAAVQGVELERMEELLMIKSGMIGHERTIRFMPVGQNQEFRAASYYIDNVMHSGASGGPVICETGHVVGVISKRAVTVVTNEELEDPNQELPSGSALAISAFSMTDYVHRQIAGLL